MANLYEVLQSLRTLIANPSLGYNMYSPNANAAVPSPLPRSRDTGGPSNLPPAPIDENSDGSLDVRRGVAGLPLRPSESPGVSAARRSPTVTPGIAGAAPPAAPTENAGVPAETSATPGDMLQQIRALREPTETPGRDLATFGFGMAASRNPSLFGQIGDAGLAMLRGRREDRQDANTERQLDVQQEFQNARVALQQAELEYQRDPTNPANIARLAQARYYEAQAARAARGGGEGGGGGGGDDRVVAREVGEDGVVYNVFRNGSVRPATLPGGEPFRRGGNPDTMDARILTARQRAFQELSADPTFATRDPAVQEPLIAARTRQILEDMRGANVVRQQREGAAPDVAAGTAGAPTAPRRVIGVDGRPIQ